VDCLDTLLHLDPIRSGARLGRTTEAVGKEESSLEIFHRSVHQQSDQDHSVLWLTVSPQNIIHAGEKAGVPMMTLTVRLFSLN